jgi:DNA-binding transcriptional LysR family regulator
VGLSTPAMSHALARIREQVGDMILVRSGKGMLLTRRAEELKPQVHALVRDAHQALEPRRRFVAAEMTRTFVVLATDYVLNVLGLAVDRIFRQEAPGACLRFVPNTPDDSALLRDGGVDLAVGIYSQLPDEMLSKQLITDRFVCVVRKGHPSVGKRITLDQFVQLPHIQVAPRGKPGGYLDDELRDRGLARTVARAVLQLAAETDYVLTISRRIAEKMAPRFGLKVLDAPLPLEPYALSLVWHPRVDRDPGHRFLRQALVRAAQDERGGS